MSEAQPVAIVTGSGRGMGAACARELHTRGYRLALMSPSGNASKLAGELGAIGLDGSTSAADDIDELVAAALEAYGRVDAVINHTGGPPKGELLEIGDEQWLQGHELLLLSVIRMCRRVTPPMLQQGGGAIVNITTFAAFEPSLIFPVSCVYRAGLGAFAKLYADRYAAEGIRMNNLLPGFIDSLAHSAETAAQVPMRRIGTVTEIAKAAAFLLSEDASYITGQNLRVDGGITRHV